MSDDSTPFGRRRKIIIRTGAIVALAAMVGVTAIDLMGSGPVTPSVREEVPAVQTPTPLPAPEEVPAGPVTDQPVSPEDGSTDVVLPEPEVTTPVE